MARPKRFELEADYGTAPNRYQELHIALAQSHIVSAIGDRNELNELCTDCVIRNGYSRYAVAQVAAQVMTDQQDLRKIRETLNEMIADGEVTAKIDPMTGEVRYRVAYRRV